MTKQGEIQSVPTNIITGFLGVGKTSTILNLLKNKPENERWAILVNEFGEIGIDGSLLEGQAADQSEDNGVFIREVPGGCMCCASGVPMQVALNQLLTNAKPDRLLIEPTGLGHPKEVLEVLTSEHYEDVLSLQKTITLVDARKLADERYTSYETFNQQIAIADIVIGNKLDRYEDDDKTKLIDYVKEALLNKEASVIFAEYGDINPVELEGETSFVLKQACDHADHDHEPLLTRASGMSEEVLPECGFIKAVNEGEGFQSCGWRFSSDFIFDKNKLVDFMWTTGADRIKAVVTTNTGIIGLNLADDILSESELSGFDESRIEIISKIKKKQLDEELEVNLMKCIMSDTV